jgi:ribosomal protein S24E
MELTITKKRDNLLLSRMEITLEVDFVNEPTPKKEDIKKKIVSSEKADEKLVVVKGMKTSFSSGKANVLVHIYKSEEEMKKTEPQNKGKSVKEGDKAAPKAEAKKEEKPKEEAPKAEEKPKEETIVPNSSSKAQTKKE